MDIPLQPASLSHSANLIIFHHLGLSHTQSGINLLSFSLPPPFFILRYFAYIFQSFLRWDGMKSYRCPIKNCIIACWLRMSRDRCFNVWQWRELNLMKFSGDKYIKGSKKFKNLSITSEIKVTLSVVVALSTKSSRFQCLHLIVSWMICSNCKLKIHICV